MQIVGMVAMSHSPSWDLKPVKGPASAYVEAVKIASERVRDLRPELIVVFGPDHVRNFFFDMMPAFCIGVETVTGYGDYSSPQGSFPTSPQIAERIAETVGTMGFDPAVSYNMGVDHGISQPYAALLPDLDIPILPIMVSSGGPPLPTFRRCHEFGKAVGEAIRKHPGRERVVVVGSGGMSHSPPSVSPADPELSKETRDYVINGRPHVDQFNAARERSSLARRKSGGTGPINEGWDKWVLDCLQNDISPLLDLSNAALRAEGGTGGQELRSWIAAMGAWGDRARTADYVPVPTWITGMGCITAFKEDNQ